ncbi:MULTISPECIES: DMT family transporter [Crossiella]|uniref:Quaternary ammonium compound-resistance protein SugE n=1 Tax=Crossiella cryophila TaxID=43355 RepID=A0A7W7FYC1_9PSEU|nr:SMR family transporter [Crossiella cryophila]MBB4679899.1 quaternary ammonium compound-resistance protein SugE [Crossiella cryophila]
MAWVVLVISGVFEAVWAVALSVSDGLRRPVPTIVFVVGLVLSMGGLAYALRQIPVGTGYLAWVGIGAVGATVYGMVANQDPVTVARVLCLGLVVAGVVGLKVL